MRASYLGLAVLTASLLSSGCSLTGGLGESEFTCRGYSGGVGCKSAREVYALTEHSRTPAVNTTDTDKTQVQPGSGGRTAARRRGRGSEPVGSDHGPVVQVVEPGRHFELEGPTPIRTPAGIMRVWVNSYEDKDGDLHVPGLVYTEVQERTWNLGERAPQGAGQRVRSLSGQTLKP